MTLYSETFGQGPDLLLLHGWAMHSGVWGEFADLLARDFRVTAVDLPGHGYSPGLAGEFADWVQAVLAVAPPRARWLGWSLGACIALQAAAQSPERVRSLALLSGSPCFLQRPDWPAAMAPAVFELFSDLVASAGAGAVPRFLALQTQGARQARPLMKQMQALLAQRPEPQPEALRAGLDMLRQVDLRRELAELRLPLLALLGSDDALVPAAAGEAMCRLNPALQLAVLPGAAHQAFLSHPAQCAERVAKFLAEHAAA
jgi:pimeloyl-[acyl-carrier protein] methyl ester esterase